MEQATYTPPAEKERRAAEPTEASIERIQSRERMDDARRRYARYLESIDSAERLAGDIVEWVNDVRGQLTLQKEKLAHGNAEASMQDGESRSSDWHYSEAVHWSQVAYNAIQRLRDMEHVWSGDQEEATTIAGLELEMIHVRRLTQNALDALSRSADHQIRYQAATVEADQSESRYRLIDISVFGSEHYFGVLEWALSSRSLLAFQQVGQIYGGIAGQLSEQFRQTALSRQSGASEELPEMVADLITLWPEFVARDRLKRSIDDTNKTFASMPDAAYPEIIYIEPFSWNFDMDEHNYAGVIAELGDYLDQSEDPNISLDEARMFIDEMTKPLVDTLEGSSDNLREWEMSEAAEVIQAITHSLPKHFTTWLLLATYLDDGFSRDWEKLGQALQDFSIEQLIPGATPKEIELCQELATLTAQFDFMDPDQWDLRQQIAASAMQLVTISRQRLGQSLVAPLPLQIALSNSRHQELNDAIREELMPIDQLDQPLLREFALLDSLLRTDATLLKRILAENLSLNHAVAQLFDDSVDKYPINVTADQVAFLTNELPLSLATDAEIPAAKTVDALLNNVGGAERAKALQIILDRYPEFRDTLFLNGNDIRLSTLIDMRVANLALFDWMMQLAEESPSQINNGVVQFFSRLDQGLLEQFVSVIPELRNIDENPEKGVAILQEKGELIRQLDAVPSPELWRLKDRILEQLLSADDSVEKFRQIKLIFEQNNTPDVAKIFLVFQTLFPREEFAAQLNDRSSPILRHAGYRQRYALIFRDLLKVHIESGSPNLYAYLESLQDNQNLIDAMSPTELAATSSASRQQLSRFLRRLEALSAASSRPHSVDTSLDPNKLYERLTHLRAALGASEGQSLSDRIVEMYGKSLGYQTIDEILRRGGEAAAMADQRNRAQILEDGNWVQIKSGDLLKGIKHEFTASMAANGIVAKEYLGASSDSDSTPYDTDLSLVDDIEAESNQSALAGSLARGYGDIIIGFHDRGQFYKTDALEQPNIYESKYELFTSGFYGDKHMGIRTGVPFTEVDYILIDRENMAAASVDRLIFTIAQLPYYVPVADHDGLLLFSPEDIDSWRIDYQKITELFNDPKIDGQAVVKALSRVWYLGQQYEASAGVSEGYTLGEHTAMVIDQFNKYFNQVKESGPSESWLPLTKEEFTLLLALHDIGKPEGIRIHGSTTAQHQHSQELVSLLLANSPFSYDKRELMTSMVSQDYVGEYFKDNVNVDVTADRIKHMAAQHGIDMRQLLPLLLMYYTSDAGAYTSDAGGAPSLDRLFTFNNQGDSIPTATLNPPLDEKWDALWQAATA